MCLLTFIPAGKQPDEGALLRGIDSNPHGNGFAIVHCDQVIVRKSMDGDKLLSEFMELREQCPDGPAIFHSRITTHGATTEDNCHPFNVGHDPRTVFAHNGIMPNRVQPRGKDQRSDTRITAEDFLPRFGNLNKPTTRKAFTRWMTANYTNKAVILTVDPRYSENAYLFNEAAGMWDDGIWYSNDSYQPNRWNAYAKTSPWTSSTLGTGGWDDYPTGTNGYYWCGECKQEESVCRTVATCGKPRKLNWERYAPTSKADSFDRCSYCGNDQFDAVNHCAWCGTCLDCDSRSDLCQCYAPSALTSDAGTDYERNARGVYVPVGGKHRDDSANSRALALVTSALKAEADKTPEAEAERKTMVEKIKEKWRYPR